MLFSALDRVEGILSKQRYIAGNQITEADVRLFMTLIRFDEVYVVSQGEQLGRCVPDYALPEQPACTPML